MSTAFALRRPDVNVNRTLGFDRPDPGPRVNLIEEFRPKTLADVFGQGYIVGALMDFAASPRSHAFLFDGPTGTGKTSTARALANELGVHPTAGLWTIDSGKQDTDALDELTREFRFAPMFGWRLVIVEEADWMARAPKVANQWLSILDAIPPRTVIVFTTNYPDKFPDRFLDRVERFTFASDAPTLAHDAQLLIDRIWSAKVGRGRAPRLDDLDIVRDGCMSFRRVVGALEPIVRAELAKRSTAAPLAARCEVCRKLFPAGSLAARIPGHCVRCTLGGPA